MRRFPLKAGATRDLRAVPAHASSFRWPQGPGFPSVRKRESLHLSASERPHYSGVTGRPGTRWAREAPLSLVAHGHTRAVTATQG